MPRLKKQSLAAIKAKYNKIGEHQALHPQPIKQYSIAENEKEFITETKIQILNLPYKYIMWIGAKYGGKTRPVILRLLGLMLEDPAEYALALKKYKTNAAIRLHAAVSNMARELRSKGYNVPLMQKGISNSYLMKSKIRELNQTVEYASLDDMDGIAGIEAPNLGKFGLVHIEEPVMKGDKEQPTKKDFWETIKILESSVDRSNARYAEVYDEEPVFPAYHFTMNAWDQHPIIEEAEEVFPENEFLNWALGVEDWEKITADELREQWEGIKESLQVNTTAVRTVTKDSKAFVRLTMFGNPGWAKTSIVYNSKIDIPFEEQVENFWDGIKTAILKKDYSSLAIYLGLAKQEGNENKTYDLSLLDKGDTVKEIKEGKWEILGTSQGWDVDINRLFAGTPVVLGRRMNFNIAKYQYKLFVLPQNPFPAYGDGGGRNIPIYKKKLKEKTTEIWQDLTTLIGKPQAPYGRYLYVDDNQSMWISYFWNDARWVVDKAKKHGDWEILARQAWLNMAINSGFIMIDDKNTQLLKELAMSSLAKGSDKRDESGTLNKNYDLINSMEYAIYPFRGVLNQIIM